MDVEPSPGLGKEVLAGQEQRPALAPLAVQLLSMLALPQAAVDELVSAKVASNPLLVAGPGRRCRWCGRRVRAAVCPACRGEHPRPASAEPAAGDSVIERLRRDARAELPTRLSSLVDGVVACLDGRGLLPEGVEGTAALLGRPVADVALVIGTLRQVGPPGVAAADAVECLDLQARWHVEHGAPGALALIVPRFLEAVGDGDHDHIAGALGLTLAEVRAAVDFLRARLRPFPVFEVPPEAGREGSRPPDVILRRSRRFADALDVQVLGAADMGVQIDEELVVACGCGDDESRSWLAERLGDARGFVDLLDRRAATLRRVAVAVTATQAGFVLGGEAHHVALSRTDVAVALALHPSTVSRAAQSKVVRLPDGRLEPFASFFGRAVPTKALLRTLLRSGRRRTDAQLAAELGAAGHRVARRTVAKYRRQLERAGTVQ